MLRSIITRHFYGFFGLNARHAKHILRAATKRALVSARSGDERACVRLASPPASSRIKCAYVKADSTHRSPRIAPIMAAQLASSCCSGCRVSRQSIDAKPGKLGERKPNALDAEHHGEQRCRKAKR